MEQRDAAPSLGIATVPVQAWGELYGMETAFLQGTVFPDLDMPFFASDPLPDTPMHNLQQLGFMIQELVLYLDTHPDDETAFSIYQENSRRRKELKETFAKRFYPLTRDCMAGCGDFGWKDGEPPWEGGCC